MFPTPVKLRSLAAVVPDCNIIDDEHFEDDKSPISDNDRKRLKQFVETNDFAPLKETKFKHLMHAETSKKWCDICTSIINWFGWSRNEFEICGLHEFIKQILTYCANCGNRNTGCGRENKYYCNLNCETKHSWSSLDTDISVLQKNDFL